MKKYRRYILIIASPLLLLFVYVSMKWIRPVIKYHKELSTTVVANEPQTNSTIQYEEEKAVINSEEESSSLLEEEERLTFELDLKVKKSYDQGVLVLEYAYVTLEEEILKEMSRQEYHAFIDRISLYPYDYVTIVTGDGKGIVYHPSYAYWGLYGTLDEEYYIKEVIHYIDAKNSEVEFVSEDTVQEVKQFVESITNKYKKQGLYQLEVDFLYDNIYQVNLQINIKSDDPKDAKEAIKEIEQKTKTSGYRMNFRVSCVNDGEEVIVMLFGEEYLQYVYVENGHRITLDTLDKS